MTVAELIAKLQELPQEAEVRIYEDYDGRAYFNEFAGAGTTTYKGKLIVWLGDEQQAWIDHQLAESAKGR